jgi:hypothetical protein
VAVTIVTGRMYSGTRDLARSLLLDGPIGCLDGSAIVAVREDRHLVSRALAGEAGRVLRAALAVAARRSSSSGTIRSFTTRARAPFAPYVRGWTSRITHVDDVTAAPHWETEAGRGGRDRGGDEGGDRRPGQRPCPAAALVAPVAFPVSHAIAPRPLGHDGPGRRRHQGQRAAVDRRASWDRRERGRRRRRLAERRLHVPGRRPLVRDGALPPRR